MCHALSRWSSPGCPVVHCRCLVTEWSCLWCDARTDHTRSSTLVKACPHCRRKVRQSHFSATVWTGMVHWQRRDVRYLPIGCSVIAVSGTCFQLCDWFIFCLFSVSCPLLCMLYSLSCLSAAFICELSCIYSVDDHEEYEKTMNATRCVTILSARQHTCYSALYAIARPSVCPSVRPSHGWISERRLKLGSRNLHHRVAPWPIVSWRLTSPWNSKGKIGSGGAEWHRGRKNTQFSANKSPYLRNGVR